MNGADLLIDCLKKQEVEVLFGIPGAQLRDIYAALYKTKKSIRHITARHEGGASLMAVGYARATNKPGICLTISGPGASNAYTGILEAYTACDPILLIIVKEDFHNNDKDQAKLQHGFDQWSAFYPVTKYMEKIATVKEIPRAVETAFEIFHSGRPGPVLLEISCQALSSEINIELSDKKNKLVKTPPPKELLTQAVQLLAKSRRPIILAGRGVYHAQAYSELHEFSKLLNAPVATTALGKGVIPECEPLSVGYIRTQLAKKVMADSDIMVALGTRFVQTDTENWTLKFPQPLIHIDVDPDEINKEYMSDVGITGDLKPILRQLIRRLKFMDRNWDSRLDFIEKLRGSQKKTNYMKQIRQMIATDAIFCVDVHRLGYSACKSFEVYVPNTFLHSPISMTLGFALPAAIGAKIAFPERQVIVFCGDGGFLLSSPEFATMIKYNLGIVIIIYNDNAYGTIKDMQMDLFGNLIGVDLVNPDFIKFAEAYGVNGFKVNGINKLSPALKEALLLNKPVLIEVLPEKSIRGRIHRAVKAVGKQLKVFG